MRAGRYDMVIPIGEDWAKDFTWFNDRKLTDTRDFSGYTAQLVIGARFTLNVTINANVMSVELTHAQTAAITNFAQDDWHLKVTNPEGSTTTWLKGKVTWKIQ